VADAYYFDHRGTLTVRCTYFDAGREPIEVEFDSVVETDAAGRALPAGRASDRADRHQAWKTATVCCAGRLREPPERDADFALRERGRSGRVARGSYEAATGYGGNAAGGERSTGVSEDGNPHARFGLSELKCILSLN